MSKEFFVAGVQHRMKENDKVKSTIAEMAVGDILILEPEPTNRFDPNAVKIIYKGQFLGYVPAKFSAEVAVEIDIYGDGLLCLAKEVNPTSKPWEMLKVNIQVVHAG